MRAPKAPKPYPEQQKDGRIKWMCKSREDYNGVKWICTGSARATPAEVGRREAKQRWQQNYLDKIAAIEGERNRKAGRVKLKDAMPAWYELYMRNKTTGGRPRSALTIETDKITMRPIVATLGQYNVCDIDADVLQRYFNNLVARGTGASVIRKQWIILNQFFARHDARNNPLALCQKPQTKKVAEKFAVDDESCEPKRSYTNAEMEKLATVLLHNPAGKNREQANERGKMLVVIMWHFLRLAEAAELRVKDVDFGKGVIHVRRQYDELHNDVVIPKDNSKRDVPIEAHCRDILQAACAGKHKSDLVFSGAPSNAHGGRVLRGALRDTLTAACAAAGLERHHVHDLRHDGISYQVRRDVKPQSIQKWAGHSSLSVTLDIYYRDSGEDDPTDLALMAGIPQDNIILSSIA